MMFGESKSRVLSFLEYVIVCEIVFFLGGVRCFWSLIAPFGYWAKCVFCQTFNANFAIMIAARLPPTHSLP